MDYRTHRLPPAFWAAILLLVPALVLVAADAGRLALRTGAAASLPSQDVSRIESRLSLLEQRFYSIDASIRGLEQQSRLSGINAGRRERDPEVSLLRAEAEALRQRLAEIECGLARVDERTLSPAAREMRRKAASGVGDPCRLNADAPLRLQARP